jgi:uncharacterized RDD family membrane protein YckC
MDDERLASIKKRVLAYAIDDILISTIFIIILWEQIRSSTSVDEVAVLLNSMWLFMVTTQIVYHAFFVWQYGATIGKIAMKIEVIELQSGIKPRFSVALNRAIFRIVSGMIFYLGFVWAFFDPKRQTLHDKTASTLVVSKE